MLFYPWKEHFIHGLWFPVMGSGHISDGRPEQLEDVDDISQLRFFCVFIMILFMVF